MYTVEDIKQMPSKQLKQVAFELEIPGYGKLSKDVLVCTIINKLRESNKLKKQVKEFDWIKLKELFLKVCDNLQDEIAFGEFINFLKKSFSNKEYRMIENVIEKDDDRLTQLFKSGWDSFRNFLQSTVFLDSNEELKSLLQQVINNPTDVNVRKRLDVYIENYYGGAIMEEFNENFTPITDTVQDGIEWLQLVSAEKEVNKTKEKVQVEKEKTEEVSVQVEKQEVKVVEKEEIVKDKVRRIDIFIQLSESQKGIVNNSSLNKSEKMRRLYRSGLQIKQIYRILNVDYVFVYDVIQRYKQIINQK